MLLQNGSDGDELTATLHCTTEPAVVSQSARGKILVSASLFCGCRLQLPAYAFDLPKDPQQVVAQNLLDVALAVPPVKQGLSNLWQVGGRIDPLRRRPADSIEI